jgi:hypothetical protein
MANNAPFYDVGLYQGRVLQQGIGKSGTGTPQFVLKIKVLGPVEGDGTFTPSRQQYERTIYMSLTEKTLPFTVETLGILGFTGDKISQLDPSNPNHQSFVGKDFDFWCSHEDRYEGEGQRERWQVSKGSQALELKPLNTKGARQLDSLFGKALAANKSKVKAVAPKDEDQNIHGVEIDDADIPF